MNWKSVELHKPPVSGCNILIRNKLGNIFIGYYHPHKNEKDDVVDSYYCTSDHRIINDVTHFSIIDSIDTERQNQSWLSIVRNRPTMNGIYLVYSKSLGTIIASYTFVNGVAIFNSLENNEPYKDITHFINHVAIER